ncbi:hypothetical protein GCM10008944_03780 [Cytobacillus oceanisediminis]
MTNINEESGRQAALYTLFGSILEDLTTWVGLGTATPAETRVHQMMRIFNAWLGEDIVRSPEHLTKLLEVATQYLAATSSNQRLPLGFELNRLLRTIIQEHPDSMEWSREERDSALIELARIATLDELEKANLDVRAATDRIVGIEETAREAVGSAAASALGKNYADRATIEESAANLFRFAALGLLVGLCVLVAAMELRDSGVLRADLETFLGRLSLTVPFVLLLAYLIREAGQHRRLSRSLRETENRLTTLPAYLEGIDDAQTRSAMALVAGKAVYSTSDSSEAANADQETGGVGQSILMMELLTVLRDLNRRGTS